MTGYIERIAPPIAANPFAQKLTFERRCFALALYAVGGSATRIAQFIGIHYETMKAIIRTQSPHYKNVRREYERLGAQEFADIYLGMFQEDYEKFKQFEKDSEAASAYQSTDPDGPNFRPNQSAKRYEGAHTQPRATFDVTWQEGAWWYNDSVNRDGPFGNSTEAYERYFYHHQNDKWKEPAYLQRRREKAQDLLNDAKTQHNHIAALFDARLNHARLLKTDWINGKIKKEQYVAIAQGAIESYIRKALSFGQLKYYEENGRDVISEAQQFVDLDTETNGVFNAPADWVEKLQ